MNGHSLLASAGDDIKVWDTGSYTVVKQFNPHAGNVSRICWSHNNNFLASASTTGDKIGVAVTNAAFGCKELDVAPDQTCVAFSASGKYLLTAGRSGVLNVYDLKARKLQRSFEGNTNPVTCVTYNGNDTYIAGGTETGEICLYSTVTTQAARPLVASAKAQAVQDLQYSYFKKALLASATDEGSVLLWDTATRCLLHSFAGVHKAPAMGLAFSPLNNMLLMSVGLDKTVVFYDVTSKSVPKVMPTDSPLTSIDIMSDGHTLAVGTTRGFIYLYDLRKASHPIGTYAAHKSSVRCLRFQRLYKADADHGPTSSNGPVNAASASSRPKQAQHSSASASSSPRSAVSQPSPRSGGGGVGAAVDATPGPSLAALASAPTTIVRTTGSASNLAGLLEVFSPTTAATEGGYPQASPRLPDAGEVGNPLRSGGGFPMLPASPVGGLVFSPAAGGGGDGGPDTVVASGLQSPVSVTRHGASRVLPLLPDDRQQLQQQRMHLPNGHASVGSGSSDGAVTLAQLRSAQSPAPFDVLWPTAADDAASVEREGFRPPVQPATAQRRSPRSPRVSSSSGGGGGSSAASALAAGGSSSQASSVRSPRSQKVDAAIGTTTLSHDTWPAADEAPAAADGSSTGSRSGSRVLSGARIASATAAPEAVNGGVPDPGILQFQTAFMRSVVADALDEFREDVQRDIRNLHAEMVRQLHIQETAIRALFQSSYDVSAALLEENQRLREEVARLKKTY